MRIDASSLHCRVVGEGGNSRVAQHARVEYALRGGRINNDAIDNSGGVDCSDREVNIKVLLDQVVADGDLTRKQRDELLVAMTGTVGELVLKDNREQTETLSWRRRTRPGWSTCTCASSTRSSTRASSTASWRRCRPTSSWPSATARTAG